MRAWTPEEQRVWESSGRELTAWTRALVKDSAGTWRDLSTYAGVDLLLSATLEEGLDDDGARLTLELALGVEALSLAPLHQASPLNRAFSATGPYAPLLQGGRGVRLEVGVSGDPRAAGPVVWLLAFDGLVDAVEWPGDTVRLVCSDLSAALRDTWVEVERVYGWAAASPRGLRPYAPGDYAVGERVVPPDGGGQPRYWYRVTTGGYTGDEVVSWTPTVGAPVYTGPVQLENEGALAEGVAMEVAIQQLLTDNVPGVTLYTPAPSGFNLLKWLQQRTSALEAIKALTAQIGWTCRYRWDDGTSQFRLTLSAPPRTATLPDLRVPAHHQLELPTLGVAVADVRNVVQVVFSDHNDKDAEGTPKRKKTQSTDAASVAKYGRRFCELSEASTSNIGTGFQAVGLANAILEDLKEPSLSVEVRVPFCPWVQLNDLVELAPDGVHWDAFQTLAVRGYRHQFGEEAATVLTLAGKPSAGLHRWLALEVRRQPEGQHQLSFDNFRTADFQLQSVPGGFRAEFITEAAGRRQDFPFYEIHASDTPGFAPSSATLVDAGAVKGAAVVDLPPGMAKYVKVRPYAFNAGRKILGLPSLERSVTTGRNKAGHLDTLALPSHLPLNGNFEHQTRDAAAFPPDHWNIDETAGAESFGAGGSVHVVVDDDIGATKGRVLRLRPHPTQRGTVLSSPFQARRGVQVLNVYLAIRRGIGSGGSGYNLVLDVHGYADAALALETFSSTFQFSGSSSGPYPALDTWYEAIAQLDNLYANFLQLRLRRNLPGGTGSSSVQWDIGDIYVQEGDVRQPAWTAAVFENSFGDFDSVHQACAYRKDSHGVVHLKGLCKRASPALGTTIFTLPEGYRPARNTNFAVVAGDKFARLQVFSDGRVQAIAADGASWWNFVSLDGLHFDTT